MKGHYPMCSCNKKKKKGAFKPLKATDSVKVRCEACEGPLLSINGGPIPVHITTVTVTAQQYNAWVAQGYPVTLVEN